MPRIECTPAETQLVQARNYIDQLNGGQVAELRKSIKRHELEADRLRQEVELVLANGEKEWDRTLSSIADRAGLKGAIPGTARLQFSEDGDALTIEWAESPRPPTPDVDPPEEARPGPSDEVRMGQLEALAAANSGS
tara:strand:- start:2740 stop:3150 length:411 start_codon:yes stop_codon:yes gene_type:complete